MSVPYTTLPALPCFSLALRPRKPPFFTAMLGATGRARARARQPIDAEPGVLLPRKRAHSTGTSAGAATLAVLSAHCHGAGAGGGAWPRRAPKSGPPVFTRLDQMGIANFYRYCAAQDDRTQWERVRAGQGLQVPARPLPQCELAIPTLVPAPASGTPAVLAWTRARTGAPSPPATIPTVEFKLRNPGRLAAVRAQVLADLEEESECMADWRASAVQRASAAVAVTRQTDSVFYTASTAASLAMTPEEEAAALIVQLRAADRRFNASKPIRSVICWTCRDEGLLVLCSGCPAVLCQACAKLGAVPEGRWECGRCAEPIPLSYLGVLTRNREIYSHTQIK